MAHGAMKHEDFLVMLENYITERNPVGEYLEMLRKEENEAAKEVNPYIVRELACIRNLLEKIDAELHRIERAEVEHEMKFVKCGDDIVLYDFLTGRRKEIEILTLEEFHEYVNRRAGFKVY